MKLTIILAILALAFAEPIDYGYGSFHHDIYHPLSFDLSENFEWYKYNEYIVPEYMTYQFLEARRMGFTSSDFASYLSKHGFSPYHVQYFVGQFEFLSKQPFGKKPFDIFQYYCEQAIPANVKEFIVGYIHQVYKYYFQLNEEEEFKQEYLNIPEPIIEYATVHSVYYFKNGLTHQLAQYGFEQLDKSYEYAMSAVQDLEKNVVSKEFSDYLIQYLKQGINHYKYIHKYYNTFNTYKTHYVPYYFAQHAFSEIEEVYHNFQHIYQYIQHQQALGFWPQSALFVYQHLEFAYKAAEKAFGIFQKSKYGQFSPSASNEEANEYYPGFWKYYKQYNDMPYNYGYHGAQKNWISFKPYQYGSYNYGPYQHGYSGAYEDGASYKSSQYGHFQHDVYPYWHQYMGKYGQIAAA